MSGMEVAPAIPDPDAFYARLAALNAPLDAEASLRLMARLVLLLANQVGDAAVLDEILTAASAAGDTLR